MTWRKRKQQTEPAGPEGCGESLLAMDEEIALIGRPHIIVILHEPVEFVHALHLTHKA